MLTETTLNLQEARIRYLSSGEFQARPYSTRSAYRGDINRFVNSIGDLEVNSIDMVKEYLDSLEKEGLSLGTIRRHGVSISGFLRQTGIAGRNFGRIYIAQQGKKESDVKLLTKPQVDQLLELSKVKPRLPALITLALHTDIHIANLLDLSSDDIIWDQNQITIRAGNGLRIIAQEDAVELIRKYIQDQEREGPLFKRKGEVWVPDPIYRQTFWRSLREYGYKMYLPFPLTYKVLRATHKELYPP